MKVAIFDLDGTLLDSDHALADAFVRCGVARSDVTFGHVVEDECERLGITLADYLDAYDEHAAVPFAGVDALLAGLDRWAVASNKHGPTGRGELARLGWCPDVACFSDDFNAVKNLGCVLERLAVGAGDVVYIGDTDHDRLCAQHARVSFALAGWNQRVSGRPGDVVLARPGDVIDLLG